MPCRPSWAAQFEHLTRGTVSRPNVTHTSYRLLYVYVTTRSGVYYASVTSIHSRRVETYLFHGRETRFAVGCGPRLTSPRSSGRRQPRRQEVDVDSSNLVAAVV